MSDALRHRGPDDSGLWVDQDAGIVLSHRRLAILDLSAAGHQPMISNSGRYVLAFNGEIYNHRTIREDLEAIGKAPKWRGHSDTETLLGALEAWGLRLAIQRCRGMYAVALWDREESALSLTRDRMGEKPIYLARVTGGWAFASELKALRHVPGFRGVLNREAIAAFLAYGYVPDNYCIFQDVQKVPPGGILTLSAGSETPELTRYYELAEDISSVSSGSCGVQFSTPDDAARRLEVVLREVIDEQMISDVSLGCFLSGGIDSSLVAAMMQTQRNTSVLTFSIGFKDARFNEAPHAAAVARHLNTTHTELMVSEDDALALVDDLPRVYDEPFADSSQIPTILLCREARKIVTVALTGDGGDEVFGGYNRHVLGPTLLRRLKQIPTPLRRHGLRIAEFLGPSSMGERNWARRAATRMGLPVTLLDKFAEFAPRLATVENKEDLYRCFTRIIHDPSRFLRAPLQFSVAPSFPGIQGSEWVMAMDSLTYLPGDILVKVDRAAMASSLETRAPFLDARIVAEAWRLPIRMKIECGIGKSILRRILYQHVPRELIDRPKQGFAVPLSRWLRGALRGWGEQLLSDSKMFQVAGLDQGVVLDIWHQHQDSRGDSGAKLWNVLTLLNWIKANKDIIVETDEMLLTST